MTLFEIEAEDGGDYFSIVLRLPLLWGFACSWYDGPHHQFAIGPLCFCWRPKVCKHGMRGWP